MSPIAFFGRDPGPSRCHPSLVPFEYFSLLRRSCQQRESDREAMEGDSAMRPVKLEFFDHRWSFALDTSSSVPKRLILLGHKKGVILRDRRRYKVEEIRER